MPQFILTSADCRSRAGEREQLLTGNVNIAHLRRCIHICSLKPYNIKGKTVTTNAVDSTAVLLSVMIRQIISGLEGQCHLSGSCSTAWEVVALLGKL